MCCNASGGHHLAKRVIHSWLILGADLHAITMGCDLALCCANEAVVDGVFCGSLSVAGSSITGSHHPAHGGFESVHETRHGGFV